MTSYEFERVFLPDLLRFVNLASVTYILDKSFKESMLSVKEAYQVASEYCLSNYYQSLPEYDRESITPEQKEYAIGEWKRRMRHMVLRYYRNTGRDTSFKEFEDIYLSGETNRE